MKVSILLFIFILLFSCKKEHEGISDCMCVNGDVLDSVMTITNPVFETNDNQEFVSYNCAEVEIAIASVTDSAGNESCENLVDVVCISNKPYTVKLAKKIDYTSTYFTKISTDKESDKRFLINEFKENSKQIFEVNINKKREIVSITKIEK